MTYLLNSDYNFVHSEPESEEGELSGIFIEQLL